MRANRAGWMYIEMEEANFMYSHNARLHSNGRMGMEVYRCMM